MIKSVYIWFLRGIEAFAALARNLGQWVAQGQPPKRKKKDSLSSRASPPSQVLTEELPNEHNQESDSIPVLPEKECGLDKSSPEKSAPFSIEKNADPSEEAIKKNRGLPDGGENSCERTEHKIEAEKTIQHSKSENDSVVIEKGSLPGGSSSTPAKTHKPHAEPNKPPLPPEIFQGKDAIETIEGSRPDEKAPTQTREKEDSNKEKVNSKTHRVEKDLRIKTAGDPLLENPEQENLTLKEKKQFNPSELGRPKKYRPPNSEPPAIKTKKLDQQEIQRSDRALPIEIHLVLVRGGSCKVSIMGSRKPHLPERLDVLTSSGLMALKALQDEWYQGVIPADLGAILQEGADWRYDEDENKCSWVLTGREIYVLSDHPSIRGFVSQPRLVLGRKHIVLCAEHMRSSVEEALHGVGVQIRQILDESLGAPKGWLVFTEIVPSKTVPLNDKAEITNILCPVPEIEISLEGGIRLAYSTWLDGHPPTIIVNGDIQNLDEVIIDGEIAFKDEEGSYKINGWDNLGLHRVWCCGSGKTYTIEKCEAEWVGWDAYSFDAHGGGERQLTICGPLVQEYSIEGETSPSFLVPAANPLVIGCSPGECFRGLRGSIERGIPFLASPPFPPVWALPSYPLHCNKNVDSILFIGAAKAVQPLDSRRRLSREKRKAIEVWCQLILDASKKGLRIEQETEEIRQLWLSYKRQARILWRALR